MSNEAALFVISMIWLLGGRGVNLCLLIIAYYTVFELTNISGAIGVFFADESVIFGTYIIQSCIDLLFLTLTVFLSAIYQKFIKIYFAYAAIICTSLVLNGLMLYDQMIDLSIVYQLHAIRQELSIPLDVLFAVLGSALGGQAYLNHSLRTANGSNYNRSNSNHPFN